MSLKSNSKLIKWTVLRLDRAFRILSSEECSKTVGQTMLKTTKNLERYASPSSSDIIIF
jgi:hypothetical protein